MKITRINIEEEKTLSQVRLELEKQEKHKIAYPNWTDYDSYPEVSFQIAHDGTHMFLLFEVAEAEIRAVAKENNGEVWKDSCVEMFISFGDSDYYYNLEQNCIGTKLMGYRPGRAGSIHAPNEVLDTIRSYSSLGNETFDTKSGDFRWTLLSVIPVTAFWKSGLNSFNNVKARANFYKCGDLLTKPHFLSWNPVKIEQPDFHRKDFFKNISFE